MDRRLLVSLAALAAVLGLGGAPGAFADRLGGNYRGPDDIYVVREDASTSSPDSAGGAGGGSAPTGGGDSGGDDSGGSGDGTPGGDAGGGDGGGGDGGGGDGGGGDGGGGDGGGDGGGGDGGGDDGGGSTPDGGGDGTPGGGGGGGDGGGGDAGGGGAAPPGSGSGPSGPSAGGSGSSGSGTGKGKAQVDKDRIWPFYFEQAKEEYIATVLARQATPRIFPPGTSTFGLSLQPEPAKGRRMVLESDRQKARDMVLGLLKDKDSHVRDAAVVALGKSGYKDAIQFIQNAAESDSDPAVREDALLALGLSGQKDAALPVLLKALNARSTDRRERRAAYAALGLGLLGQQEGAVEPLRKMYENAVRRADQADEAACAAVALGMLGDPGALPLFAKVLGSKGASDHAKSYTVHALGKYGTHADEKVRGEALGLLVGALRGKTELKQSALLALGNFADAKAISYLVKEGLGDAEPYCKNYAAHSLGRIAGRFGSTSKEYALVAKALGEVTENENKGKWVFQAGNLALASMAYADREKKLLEMTENLTKVNLHSASSIVLSLGLLGSESPAVAKQLHSAFESRSIPTNIKAYAGLAMAMARVPKASEDLTKTLTGDSRPHADVARTSALALGLVGGSKEADVLVGILKGDGGAQQAESERFFLMGAAVQGLGLIADADTVEKLRSLVTSAEWHQRAFGCAALGYFLEEKVENRVSPRISGIFRHHNYHVPLGVVKAVQSTL